MGHQDPYGPGEDWPVRMDTHLADGVEDGDVERWVRSASLLHSNGDAMDIAVRDGRIVGVRGRADDRVNHGRLGPKDLFGWQANASGDRLTTPLVRENGRLVPTTWDAAMDRICARTRELLDEQGPSAIGFARGGLSMWTAYGNAGSPALITGTEGRVFLPTGDSRETAAFFRITNSGGSADRLLKVTSAEAGGAARLSRHRMVTANTASGQTVTSVPVPAGASLAMSPSGVDVIVPTKGTWRPGDLIAFTLHFQHSGAVRNLAVVVRPGH